ncbi:MAG TPA: Rossmann-like and DUF2520 domain-containing protein [Pyrinomonadaceae bacterium]|jgi:predicted short-subunit dehydrogenase-like oxidoreductase (DUF2520 family)
MPTERRTKAQRNLKPSSFNQRKPTISIIGAGRLGTALALALTGRGYRVEAVMARRLAHARRAAAQIAAHTRALSATQADSLPPSDLLFITTPDDQIAHTAAHLAASHEKRGAQAEGRAALHCSGALSSDVLSPLEGVGYQTGSMHPLISVSDPLQGAERLRGGFYAIEGTRSAVRVARGVVRDLGGESFSVNSRDKALYHAAALMASGHMVALLDIAVEMLKDCGLTEKRAQSVLLPLMESTLANLSARDTAHALTGTFARADAATMRRHVDALGGANIEDALEVYRLLGRRSLRLAEKLGVDGEALKKIGRLLKEHEGDA